MALKWAITEKFHDYLYGNFFTIITDNNPLTYLLTTAKLDAVSYRWLAALSTFTFNIKYQAGKQNVEGPSQMLHWDLLFPCGFLPETEKDEQDTNRPKRPRTRQQSAIRQDEEPVSTDDESHGSWITTIPNIQDKRFVKMYDIPR